jgi:hypothetical protein
MSTVRTSLAHAARAWVLLAVSAGVAHAGPWAGVPLDELPKLELRALTLDQQESRWQAATAAGFVRVATFDDEAAAIVAFDREVEMAAAVPLPAVVVAGADDARGDPSELLVLRSRNVVLVVRDRAGAATAVAQRVLAALVETAPAGVYREKAVGERVLEWDKVGRLTVR